MNDKNIFYSINGKPFTLPHEVLESKFSSVRDLGYIIPPDGRFIVITKSHHQVIKEYLSKYLEEDINGELLGNLVLYTGAQMLTDLGHAVYAGCGEKKMMQGMSGYIDRSSDYDAHGLLFLPTVDSISSEQAESMKNLLDTNRTIFGNKVCQFSIKSLPDNLKLDEEEAKDLFSKIIDENVNKK